MFLFRNYRGIVEIIPAQCTGPYNYILVNSSATISHPSSFKVAESQFLLLFLPPPLRLPREFRGDVEGEMVLTATENYLQKTITETRFARKDDQIHEILTSSIRLARFLPIPSFINGEYSRPGENNDDIQLWFINFLCGNSKSCVWFSFFGNYTA